MFQKQFCLPEIMSLLVNSEKISILEYPEHFNSSTGLVRDAILWYFFTCCIVSIVSFYNYHNPICRSCILLSEENAVKRIFRRFQCYFFLYMSGGFEVNHLCFIIYGTSSSPSKSLAFLYLKRDLPILHFQAIF